MAQIKFTKSELRSQQLKFAQLNRYLPTLQLKKAMLQNEVNAAGQEVEELTEKYLAEKREVGAFSSLLSVDYANDVFEALHVIEVKKTYESIAGVEIPHYKDVLFSEATYMLFDKPFWFDDAIVVLRRLICAKERIMVAREKKAVLEQELREVSIRVNLFEKIMIPRTQGNIKRIKVFLGDQQLAAVCQAKVAKRKILERMTS